MSDADADADTDGDVDGGLEDSTGRWRWLLTIPILLLVLLVAAYYAGVIGQPTAGVADRGDWDTVDDDRIDVVTTVWVDNPNPFGELLGDRLNAEYDVRLNGVRIAAGSENGLPLPPGNTTFDLRSTVDTDRLDEWWVAFLRDDETVHSTVEASLHADGLSGVDYTFERNRTMMADERPFSDSLAASADRVEGRYTETFTADSELAEQFEAVTGAEASLTVGYEVRRADANVTSVTDEETTIEYRLQVHNPGDVPVPVTEEGINATVAMNDVTLFASDAKPITVSDVGADKILGPGESRELRLELTMDNDRITEWFPTHVRRGERSNLTIELGFLFDGPFSDEPVRLPTDGPVTYDCEFRTAMLVDDQEGGTTCGDDGNQGAIADGRQAALAGSAAHPSSEPDRSELNPGRQYSRATETTNAAVATSGAKS